MQRCAVSSPLFFFHYPLVVPIKELGFALHKRAFRDAIAPRYGWPLHLMPSLCRCGESFEVDHVMSCRHGGFHTLRHNEIQDLLAGLFREVCHDVSVEPCLQPLTGEQFPASTNKSNEACLDIRARGFWGTGRGQQDTFFDVRVLYPFASSFRNSRLPTLYRQHESQKDSTTDSEFEKSSADASLHSFSPLEVHGTGSHSLPEAIGQHAERQARRELLSRHGLAQMCHLLLPAAIQPGMSPWVHQEWQRPNTNDS